MKKQLGSVVQFGEHTGKHTAALKNDETRMQFSLFALRVTQCMYDFELILN